jgi:hypothetical protein
MYPFILAVHNVLRWIVLFLAIVAVVRAYLGWFGGRPWAEIDGRVGLFLTISIDIQLLLGIVLYVFLSPITQAALADFGAAMGVGDLRFFALEHALIMGLLVVFAHMGRALSRRASEDTAKHRNAAILFSLALLMVILGMPWGRPLLPGL